jgi:cell filamentation protein
MVPDIAVFKAGTWFSHPLDARRAVEEGLRIAPRQTTANFPPVSG